MKDPQATYQALMAVESLQNVGDESALEHIGLLIDLSDHFRAMEGLERAVDLSEELRERDLAPGYLATLNYFVANAWSARRALLEAQEKDRVWEWEQHETEQEIIHLRLAMDEVGFRELPEQRRCQILTNLGNVLDRVGRTVEALEYWDRALGLTPLFAMARGNRGLGLTYYATVLHDRHQAALLLKEAHADLGAALSSPLDEHAREAFGHRRDWIESVLTPQALTKTADLHGFSLGRSKAERSYRAWCLERRLFLNALNDLGAYPMAAHDHLTAPSIVVGIDEGPYYHGFFNQMKQEFVSARYLYYEGVNSNVPHFSDKGVVLYNTLDYPAYSLAVERVKAAFRICYSLLDKTAYFLNHYLRLGVPEGKVSFRTLWHDYDREKKQRVLKPALLDRENLPLRGLYWLSKDLYEKAAGLTDALEPDAREVAEIRNRLEHRYLKLHDLGAGSPKSDPLSDSLAYSLARHDFEAKTCRLLKTTRATLVYLSLALHQEERARQRARDQKEIVPPLVLDHWEDDWKR